MRLAAPPIEGAGPHAAVKPQRRSAGAAGGLGSIAEAMADPLVRTMMHADRVDPLALEQALRAMAEKLARRKRAGAGGPVRS
jgi:hypothetical protein